VPRPQLLDDADAVVRDVGKDARSAVGTVGQRPQARHLRAREADPAKRPEGQCHKQIPAQGDAKR
jgi:hypothetical protein